MCRLFLWTSKAIAFTVPHLLRNPNTKHSSCKCYQERPRVFGVSQWLVVAVFLHTFEPLIFLSHRIHVSVTVVNGASVADCFYGSGTAADVPCVSATVIRRHPTLAWDHVRPVTSLCH